VQEKYSNWMRMKKHDASRKAIGTSVGSLIGCMETKDTQMELRYSNERRKKKKKKATQPPLKEI